MNVYVDIIFLYNFIGDYLCLCIAGGVVRKTTVIKKILAATAGGIYAILCITDRFSFLACRSGIFISAALITAIAYLPFRAREFVSLYVVYIMSSMLLGGGIQLLLSDRSNISLILCMTGVACVALYALSSLRGHIFSKHMASRLVYKNYNVSLNGFYDSGNRLFAYGGDMRVIIADESVLRLMFGKNANVGNLSEWVDSIQEIPFSGAAGGVMKGFMLDYAEVEQRRYTDVFLAISNNNLKDSLVLHSTMI